MALLKSTTNGGPVADATSHNDLLDKLIDFLTGVSTGTPALPVNERWAVMKDDTTSVAGERFVYLEAPGYVLNGANVNVYINIRTYSSGVEAKNWEIRGAIGFSDSIDFFNQPGTNTYGHFYTLQDTLGMPFWIKANGRRFTIITKISGATYVACYGGLYLPYATPLQFPYPLYVGANSDLFSSIWNTTSYVLGNFYDGQSSNVNRAVSSLRSQSGVWERVYRYSSSGNPATNSLAGIIWPYDNGNGGNTTGYMYGINSGIAANFYNPLPTIVYSSGLGGNVYGELDGVFACSNIDNTAESIITEEGGTKTYMVINNVYRTNEASACFDMET